MKGRIHSLESFGTVDGPGIRYVVFFRAARCAASTATIQIPGYRSWNFNGKR